MPESGQNFLQLVPPICMNVILQPSKHFGGRDNIEIVVRLIYLFIIFI